MTVRELSSSPSLLPLFGKAATTGARKHGGELPTTVYTRSHVTIDPARLAQYDQVCGFRLSDELPTTYPHLLSFPMQAKLMTDDDFPFPLIGSVHVANRITVHRPPRVDERFEVRVHAENLRAHARGKQFDMVTELSVAGTPIWLETSTYLRRGRSAESGSSSKESAESHFQHTPPSAVWRVPADIGRRYAEVSGDANPIHLHPLTAKAFGFRTAIAHGMWTKARCLAALEGRLPTSYVADFRFKLAVPLPAKVAFTAQRFAEQWTLGLRDARSGKPHLTASVEY